MTLASSPPRAARHGIPGAGRLRIHLNDLFTMFLNGSGGIESVVNGTGTAVSPTNGGPSDVLSAS